MKSPFITSSSFGVQNSFASDAAYLAFTGRAPFDSESYFNSTSGKYRYYFGGTWRDMTPVSSGGTVNGPGTTTPTAIAIWSNSTGTLLADSLILVSGTSMSTANDNNNDGVAAFGISMQAGNKTAGTGDGGGAVLQAGYSFGGNGGSASVAAGAGTAGTANGGAAFLSAGSSFGGTGGTASVTGGNSSSGQGGLVSLVAGTGTPHGYITMSTAATERWRVDATGNLTGMSSGSYLLWNTDGLADIGSPDGGTTFKRPNRAYVKSQLFVNTATVISSGDLINVANDSASSSANLVLTRFVATAGAAVIRMLKAAGTQAAKTAVTSADALALIQGGGWDGSIWKNSFNVIISSTENWTTTAHGTSVQFNAVPTGVNNATLRFAMTGDGNLTVTPHLLWAADGASDIGLSTGQRPRDLFLRRNLNIAGSTSGSITISANATTSSYTIVMPAAQGSSGDTLVNDGSGNLSWAAGSGTSGTVNTTNATPATLQTIATATDTSMLLQTKIIARRTGGTSGAADDSAGYILTALIKNVAGTVTVNLLQTDYAAEDQVGWDATLTVSGTNVLIQVTGAVNNNVTWKSNTTTQVT